MADSISHRGPDAAGYHTEPGLAFGHRRLSIIDLDSGQQPMSNEDGTVWIIFNGEIYNFLELRPELEAKGHRFRTNSDTEVIVHLYEEVGEECFSRLRGMFALAIWDRKKRKLVLGRDRVGKKPLYYTQNKDGVFFGSEIKSIHAAINDHWDLNPFALADYFTTSYIPSPKTIYANIHKLRPAHYLVVTSTGIREQEYWDISFGNVVHRTEEQWCDELLNILTDAVRVRLISDVPLGAFLSGGVDSSAVVGLMSQLSTQPVTTCTVGFNESDYSEVEYARALASKVGADYNEYTVEPRAADVVDRLAWHYDEPFADSSAIPTYYVSRSARARVTVALSGDGGDESFAGYKRYLWDRDANLQRSRFPQGVRDHVLAPLGRLYPHLDRGPKIFRAKSTLESLGLDPLDGYLSRVTTPVWHREKLFSDEFVDLLKGYDPLDTLRDYYRKSDGKDHLSKVQYLDIKTYLTDDICTKVDRASMAVSLEVRAPLLDHRLMEFVASMPSDLKLKANTGKYIFKKLVRRIVPSFDFDRTKQGFGVPVGEWFRDELKGWAQRELFDNPDPLLNDRYLRQMWSTHQDGKRDYSAFLWQVFMYRKWQKISDSSSRPDEVAMARG